MLKVLQACLSSDVQELKAGLNRYTLEVINNQGTVGKKNIFPYKWMCFCMSAAAQE